MYVPDDGSMHQKYRDCATSIGVHLYIYIYIYIYIHIYACIRSIVVFHICMPLFESTLLSFV